ncbi:hypothetical protein C1930_11405 [Stenotrophomonas sp. SAU14A_NAIMI4_8]|nr:hypothetical protein C1931_11180 [Stenotrophomonas sp. YAU14A_MKIMI4_1]AWH33423.1 hypothetical protein C1930_11405 [Stenotrophomonas sp. SAU14A_NAIMI4_8]
MVLQGTAWVVARLRRDHSWAFAVLAEEAGRMVPPGASAKIRLPGAGIGAYAHAADRSWPSCVPVVLLRMSIVFPLGAAAAATPDHRAIDFA